MHLGDCSVGVLDRFMCGEGVSEEEWVWWFTEGLVGAWSVCRAGVLALDLLEIEQEAYLETLSSDNFTGSDKVPKLEAPMSVIHDDLIRVLVDSGLVSLGVGTGSQFAVLMTVYAADMG